MNNLLTLQNAQRTAQTKGVKGWLAMFALLGAMCLDQFVWDIPYLNVVFPVLIVCAASMNIAKNFVLVTAYSVLFELSCIAWFPADLFRVQWWLLEVWIGFGMPYLVYMLFNRKRENMRIVSYAALAALGELLYFWVSAVATVLIWGVHPVAYFISDLPYEALGCLATFVCALPVAALYKLFTGEWQPLRKRVTA